MRGKYDQLWDELHALKKKYVFVWRNEFSTLEAKSIDDMIGTLSGAADELRRMKADGVTLDPEGGAGRLTLAFIAALPYNNGRRFANWLIWSPPCVW